MPFAPVLRRALAAMRGARPAPRAEALMPAPPLQRWSEPLGPALRLEFERKTGFGRPWYRAPRIIENASGFVLIDLAGAAWEAQLRWLVSGLLFMSLRRGPGESCGLVLDPAARSYRLFDQNGRCQDTCAGR